MEQMNHYIGTKAILARPMTRGAYNVYRGWTLPADENGDDEGYLVEYPDSPNQNHRDHAGYISWSPKAEFEHAYRANGAMSFGHALLALECGFKVARAGWNGKGMWLKRVNSWADIDGLHEQFAAQPFIAMKTAQNTFVPWLASQSDMLGHDWSVVE